MPDSAAVVVAYDDTSLSANRRRNASPLQVAMLALRMGPLLMLVVAIIAGAMISDVFISGQNIGNVIDQSTLVAIVAIGQLIVIITRGIDLSVGSNLALATVVGAVVFTHTQSGVLVILSVLATATAVGAFNGLVYVYGRMPHPFVVTLATLAAVNGLALLISGGQPKRGLPDELKALQGRAFGQTWLPAGTFVLVGAAVLVAIMLKKQVWGRWIYAVGGNPEGARRSGIPVRAVTVSVYMLSGLLVGIAAVVYMARIGGGSPTSGQLLELDTIAAVVIGGASFMGGRGHVGNALIGALLIGVIGNVLRLKGIESDLQRIITGAVIILAVGMDVARGHLEAKFRVSKAVQT